MNEKTNKHRRRHHGGKNRHGGRQNNQNEQKNKNKEAVIEQSISLPEFDFISPMDTSRPAEKKVNIDDVVLSPEVLARIDADIIPPIDRIIDLPEGMAEEVKKTKDEPDNDETAELVEIIGVRFKKSGKVYYFDACGQKARRGEYAIVDTARGAEFGEVWIPNKMVPSTEIVPPLRPYVRPATKEDIKHNEENTKKEEEAFVICNEKITAHDLDMKLVDVQYTFDNSKLLFYFTSAGRVDFRELVKDLASVFKTRIELRQIGIRDEAKLIGGLGICGRSLCCAGFLTDFGQVSIKMAKEQNLSLNATKISGNCGRLMCCLRYEHKAYEEEIKLTPPVDSIVKTPDGVGTVCDISPILGSVKVKLNDTEGAPKTYHRDNVKIIGRHEDNKNKDSEQKEEKEEK